MNEVDLMLIKTGNAKGSDEYWIEIAKKYNVNFKVVGFTEQHLSTNSIIISDYELNQALPYIKQANQTLKRNFPSHNEYINKLLKRNYFIIYDTQQTLAVGKINFDNTIDGGTGWGVEFAKILHKILFVLNKKDEEWYRYSYKTQQFKKEIPFIINKNISCIGSREINDIIKTKMELPFKKVIYN